MNVQLKRESLLKSVSEMAKWQGKSQYEISRITGISQPTINKTLKYRRNISLDFMLKLAKAVNMQIDLVNEETEQEEPEISDDFITEAERRECAREFYYDSKNDK